jgi:hypothetical protein
MPQFTVSLDTFGNVRVESGVVIDITNSTPVVHRFKNSNSFAIPSDSMGATRWSPKFCGGSGRNIYVNPTPGYPEIPFGFYSLSRDLVWTPENEGSLKLAMDPNTFQIAIADSDDNIIAESDGSAFNPYGKISCSSAIMNGVQGSYWYEIDLGEGTGTVELAYNAFVVPDQFIVTYNNVDVIDTGLVGVSDYYDGSPAPIPVNGPGAGTATFTKSNSYPRTAILKVIAPFSNTVWECTLGCPNGGTPPFRPTPIPPNTTKIPFEVTTTSFGEGLFGDPVTISAVYEGNKLKGSANPDTGINKTRRTTVEFTSDAVNLGGSVDYGTEWHEVEFQWWAAEYVASTIEFRTIEDGTAVMYDGIDVIAIRDVGSLIDCSGAYQSTEYGAQQYNEARSFSASVIMHRNSPMTDMIVFLALNLDDGTIISIDGPYLDYEVPAVSTTRVCIPIAMIHPDLTVDQLCEGSILWK